MIFLPDKVASRQAEGKVGKRKNGKEAGTLWKRTSTCFVFLFPPSPFTTLPSLSDSYEKSVYVRQSFGPIK